MTGKRKIPRRELGTIPRWLDGILPDASLDPDFYDIPEELLQDPWHPSVLSLHRKEVAQSQGVHELKIPPIQHEGYMSHISHDNVAYFGMYPALVKTDSIMKKNMATWPKGNAMDTLLQQDPLLHSLDYYAYLSNPIVRAQANQRMTFLSSIWKGDARNEAEAFSVYSFLENCPKWLRDKEMQRVDQHITHSGYKKLLMFWQATLTDVRKSRTKADGHANAMGQANAVPTKPALFHDSIHRSHEQ